MEFESKQIAEAEKAYEQVRKNPHKANLDAHKITFPAPNDTCSDTGSSNVESSLGAGAAKTTFSAPSTKSSTFALGQLAQTSAFSQGSAFDSATQLTSWFGSLFPGSSTSDQPAGDASAFGQHGTTSAFGSSGTGSFIFQHDTYYLDVEDIKLQAGNVVFRVHAYFFTRESDKAKELVAQSRLSPDRLVVLEDVSPKDLEGFFKVLYCR
jgi:hypothetical protein